MNDVLRLVLLLVIAALALTAVGALVARWLDPARRLTRYLRLALDATPEGVMMDRVDNLVLARCFRDRPIVPLDEIPLSAHRAVIRVVFHNPRDPEYELEIWPAMNGRGREHASPADAVHAGRKWLTRLEALLRRPAPRTLTRPAPPSPILPDEDEPPPWDEDEAVARLDED